MMDLAEAEGLMETRLSRRRAEHSRRVAATAATYARRWGASPAAAELAGLLHDICRELSAEAMVAAAVRYGIPVGPIEAQRPVGLLHARVAAAELREAGLDDDIVGAVDLHTIGAPDMTVLEKCLYLADLCEPGRDHEVLDEVRALAMTSLDDAVAAASRQTLLVLLRRGHPVVPAALDLYNSCHMYD